MRPLGALLPIGKIFTQVEVQIRPGDLGLNSVITDLPNTANGIPIDINSVALTLDGRTLVWRVDLTAGASTPADARYDVVHAQDLALAPPAAALSSEPYVCQYLLHRAMEHPDAGTVLVSRQTMSAQPRLPLAVAFIVEGAVAHLTDSLQVFTARSRRDGVPHGGVRRRASAPNCSFFTGWTKPDYRMTWEVEVNASGRYEAVVHYTCPKGDLGSEVELTLGKGATPSIHEQAHLARDPAVSPHPYCLYVAEW